jgi:hypothetical protein
MSVIFELPDGRPEISRVEALELAALLEGRRNVSAIRAASKLRQHARTGRRGKPLTLEPAESVALVVLLEDEPAVASSEAVSDLYARLRLTLLPG